MRTDSPLPFDLSGPVHVPTALAAGATPKQLRRRSLVSPVRGVRMPAAQASDLASRCRAIGLVLPGDAAFSHVTAAALWGLPVPSSIDPADPVHVIGPAGRPPLDARATAPHAGLRPGDTALLRGVRLTGVARTWVDLGNTLDRTDLVILTDAILSLGWPRTTAADLTAALAAAGRRRGCRALREALSVARHFVDSPMETRVRLQLVASGFPCPVVGADLFDDRGCWISRPDLCWPELRLAVEYDGDHHRTDRAQYVKDIHRKEQMEDYGWRSIVLLARDVLDRWSVSESRLRDAFASRGVVDLARVPDAPDQLVRPRLITPR